jgi:YbbR domain-containing protein
VLLNDKSATVAVKARGSRTMLAKLNKADITAYVDLNGYNQTGSFTIPVSVRLPYEEVSVVEKKPYGVNVQIDQLVTQEFPVTVEVTGEPRDGFEVYNLSSQQSTVEIKGPSDLVTSVERVVAALDVSGATDDVVRNPALICYNTNEDVVASKYLTLTPDKPDVRCEILKRKNVPIKAVLKDYSGGHVAEVLNNGYVTVLARQEVLDTVTELYTKPLDVSGIVGDAQVTAQIDLPPGVVIREGVTEVTVGVSVSRQ